VTKGKLYDVTYGRCLGLPRNVGYFGVYWREKTDDPPVSAYSWKCGTEDVTLSKTVDDVRIVVCSMLSGSGREVATKGKLREEYMPADLERCKVDLEYASSQDWFG